MQTSESGSVPGRGRIFLCCADVEKLGVDFVDFGSISGRFWVDWSIWGRFGVDFFTVDFFFGGGLGLLAVAAAHALETRAGLS